MRRPAHTTFVIERALPGGPRHAFSFFADPDLKHRWTACHPDWRTLEASFDFRVGGGEVSNLLAPAGVLHEFRSHYLDIVDGERIIYAYWMGIGGRRISTSMATIEFVASGSGSFMTFTEQAAVLDGNADIKLRQEGTETAFERLALELERALATVQ